MGDSLLHYRRLSEFVGQEANIFQLMQFVEFFQSRGSTPNHILLVGEEGMGQLTIARTLANELDAGFQHLDAASFVVESDLSALMTNIREKQVLFIENIHQLRTPFRARLASALRDYKMSITIGQGPAARTHVMELKAFTLIATSPRKADCPAELLEEFSLVLNLQPYSMLELQRIAEIIAASSGIMLDHNAAALLAMNSDGRPRHVEQLFQKFARAINKERIFEDDLEHALTAFGMTVHRHAVPCGVSNLQSLSGQEFERLVTTLLSRMGFRTELTKASGDGGIDIIAAIETPIFGGRYLFQCKRFALDNIVGASAVRDFYGAVTAERAVKGIFITTSDFTVQAREFAQKSGVELINADGLEKLMLDLGLSNVSAAQAEQAGVGNFPIDAERRVLFEKIRNQEESAKYIGSSKTMQTGLPVTQYVERNSERLEAWQNRMRSPVESQKNKAGE